MLTGTMPAQAHPTIVPRPAPPGAERPPVPGAQGTGPAAAPPPKPATEAATTGGAGSEGPSLQLSEEERAVVAQLQARDREVRAHEEAHARVGGEYAGEPSYTYEVGPDGRQYAVGGEVPIDVSVIPDDPEATIEKMEVVKRAALAPAEPSSADRRVAAEADAKRLAAMADLMELRAAEQSTGPRVDIRL